MTVVERNQRKQACMIVRRLQLLPTGCATVHVSCESDRVTTHTSEIRGRGGGISIKSKNHVVLLRSAFDCVAVGCVTFAPGWLALATTLHGVSVDVVWSALLCARRVSDSRARVIGVVVLLRGRGGVA